MTSCSRGSRLGKVLCSNVTTSLDHNIIADAHLPQCTPNFCCLASLSKLMLTLDGMHKATRFRDVAWL